MTGIMPVTVIAARDSARRSPMGWQESLGSIATRIFAPGGAIRISTASTGLKRQARPAGCRSRSRSGLRSLAARRWTRGRTSRMSFPIRSRRKMPRPISRMDRAPMPPWSGFCAPITNTGQRPMLCRPSMADRCWIWTASISGSGTRDLFRNSPSPAVPGAIPPTGVSAIG